MSATALPADADELRAVVAGLVGATADEIADGDDLVLDWALDSVRAMAFVGRLREAGVSIDLMELSDVPTVAAWWRLIATRRPAGS
ncbi:phosphopantetheine-binding protein [Patulibacter minatonensis]|uniref:phosphopantetheine-binding protein n=1 Tax=Patulibacter minatonensis TaxID=298163 RepID=UPI00047C90C4|nr:phosphopantetheine-binding protein [Patulibacter minatonensis]